MGIGEAVIFYWICWILAIPLTKVVLLPLFSLTYLESAGEIRRIEWSIPESQVPLPVLAAGAEAGAAPAPWCARRRACTPSLSRSCPVLRVFTACLQQAGEASSVPP